jgi:hypothetical protein
LLDKDSGDNDFFSVDTNTGLLPSSREEVPPLLFLAFILAFGEGCCFDMKLIKVPFSFFFQNEMGHYLLLTSNANFKKSPYCFSQEPNHLSLLAKDNAAMT